MIISPFADEVEAIQVGTELLSKDLIKSVQDSRVLENDAKAYYR